MTLHEFVQWQAYERVFGPLTIHERVDAGMAIAAWASVAAMGAKNVSPEDFLPDWSGGSKEPEPQSDEQIMAMMRKLAERSKKRKKKG